MMIIQIIYSFLLFQFTLGYYNKQTVRANRNSKDDQRKFEIRYKLDKYNAVKEDADNADSPVVLAESTIIVVICGQHNYDICEKQTRFLENYNLQARKLNAAIVFVEHRYYGESRPRNGASDLAHLSNLRVLEVLEDIREVVEKGVAEKLNLKETKPENIWERTLLVGVDYAGALALWMAMAKDGKKRPKFIWSASPSPLALFPDAPLSPRFDHQLAQLLEQFDCRPDLFRSLFEFMDHTAASGGNGLEIVKAIMLYKGEGDIETVKGKVLQWLRQFVAYKNVPTRKRNLFWPLEKFCMNLKNASTDGESLAKAFAAVIQENAKEKLNEYDYDEELLNAELEYEERVAKYYQQCTELAHDNCAAGGKNDPFFEQCKDPAEQHITTMCKKLLPRYPYNPDSNDSKLQLDFINNTFSFDFGQLQNVLITSGELDQFAFPKNLIKSDSSRKVIVFQSIGLNSRGHELDRGNECDSLALKQARTQIFDILVCTFFPAKCVPTTGWPYPLSNDSLALDASTHNGTCDTNDRDYPWAVYANGVMGKKQGMLLTMTMITFAITALFF